jgi:enolase
VRWIDKYPIVSIEDPLRGRRRIRSDRVHARRRRESPDRRRRLSRDRRGSSDACGICWCVQWPAGEAEPGGHCDRDTVGPQAAKRAGYSTIVSARSGETEDVADHASRHRLECRPAQGRLFLT